MTFTDDSADRPARRVGGAPDVPGVSLRSRLRDAGGGELWAGQFDQTGVECVVRRVRLAPDPVLRSAAAAAAWAVADLDHPHLAAVVAVLPTAEGLALVTEPVVGGISLARLLAVRGALDPGEVVTVGLPVAQALAAAHAAGIVHGRLEREDILLEPNGRPVLTGVGVAALADAARPDPVPPQAASADVHDLATLLLSAMREATGPDAAAVAVAVATALIDDPRRRPSAVELAAALARSAIPLPVRLLEGDEEPGAAPRGPADPTPTETLATIPAFGTAQEPVPPGLIDSPSHDDPAYPADPGRPNGRMWPAPATRARPDSDGEPPGRDVPPVPAEPDPALADGPARPDRTVTGATAVDAAELLDSLPPPPRRSTRATVTGRKAGRDPARGTAPPRPGPSSSRAGESPASPPDSDSALASRGRPGPAGRSASSARDPAAGPGSAGTKAADRARPARRDRPAGSPSSRRPQPDSARRPRRVGARRHRWLLPVTAALGLLAVVVAGVLLTVNPSDDDSPGAASAPPATDGTSRDPTASPVADQSAEQVWRSVLAELNVARSRAFERADEEALQESDAAGSPLHTSDIGLMRQMVGKAAHASPLRTEIIDLQVRVEEPDRTVLRVTQRLDAYDFLDADGQVLAHQEAKTPERRDLTLVRTESGWRASENVAVTDG